MARSNASHVAFFMRAHLIDGVPERVVEPLKMCRNDGAMVV